MKLVTIFTLSLVACGTLAEGDGGGENLPNRGIIPFDKLEAPDGDESSVLPFVLVDAERDLDEPAIVTTDDGVDVYLQVTEESQASIQRASSSNGVDFGAVESVLEPELDWEGSWVGAPSVVSVGGQLLLLYLGGTSHRAVGLARSTDGGVTWTREAEPVFDPEDVIASPAAVALNDGLILFYAVLTVDEEEELVPTRILMASSTDGLTWTGGEEVLSIGTGCANEDGVEVRCWDSSYITSPGARVSTSSIGRTVVDLWYTGGVSDDSNIGFAGSFDDLRFERFPLNPVLEDRGPEAAAFVAPFQDHLLMYYSDEHEGHRAIALATNGK